MTWLFTSDNTKYRMGIAEHCIQIDKLLPTKTWYGYELHNANVDDTPHTRFS